MDADSRAWRRAWAIADRVAVAGVVAAVIADTEREWAGQWHWLIVAAIWAGTAFFAADVVLRCRLAIVHRHGWRRGLSVYLRSASAWVDVVAAAAVPAALLAGLDRDTAYLFGLVGVLKLGRYSSGMGLLRRVARNAAEPLLSVLLAFVIVWTLAATLAYLLEHTAQPATFGSIPLAMWWAIVTLTTTGYGDATPVTLAGRVLAGVVMVSGIGVFALWAGILASGFADELRRRDFLRNWDLVAKVPFFTSIGAGLIGEVARLLRRHEVAGGQTVFQAGEPGEAMYFIVSGAVEVRVPGGPVRLSENGFFGEMALISGAPRTASVVALDACILLELGVAEFRQLAGSRPELMDVIHQESSRRSAS